MSIRPLKSALLCIALLGAAAVANAVDTDRALRIIVRDAKGTLLSGGAVSAGTGDGFMIKADNLSDGTYYVSGFGTKATLRLEHPRYGSAIVDISLPPTRLVSVDILWANGKVSADVNGATVGRMALVDAGDVAKSDGAGVFCPAIGCQLPDQMGHGAGQVVAATSDLNPNFGFRVADTMLPIAGGVVSNVCWWGSYFSFDLGTSCGISLNDAFSVSYYQDDAGGEIPGTLIAGPLPVILTAKFTTGNLLLGFIPEYQYEAFHAPVLLGNERVWIEIVNDTPAGDCGWLWSTSAPGDGQGALDGPAPNGTYDIGEGRDFDMAFGVDIPIGASGPVPSNDLCADAIGPMAVPSVESGTTIGATFDDVGFCGTSNTASGVWYTVIGTGNTMTATTCENQSFPGSADYDTKISIFSGSCASLTCVAGNDDESGCSFHSTVMWCSQVGVEYRILVHGFSSATGNFDLAVSDNGVPCGVTPANDLCEDAIGPLSVPSVVSGSTDDATFDDVGFCGTSNTAPGIWYTVIGTGNPMTATTCENQSFPGSANYDTKISVFSGSCASLTCVAGNDDESGCSFHSTVLWSSQVGVEYRILVHGFSSATGNFDLAVSDAVAPANDACADAIGPLAVPSVVSGTTDDATFDGVGTCFTSNTAPGVWYTVIGTGNTMTATTCENQSFPGSADYDTKISIFSGSCASLTCVAGNDDEPGCSFHSTVTWCSQVGVEYLILVHGFSSATGNFDLAVSDSLPCGPPPNDLCADAIGPLAVPSVVSGTTIDATFDDAPFCGTSNTAPGVWYTVIGTGTTMTATTCENQSFPGSADYDTKISVFCGDCPTVPASNCCTSHFGLGCDDSTCQATVCGVDPFCCATAWDSICAGEAADLCGDLCATGAICVTGNDDEPGCSFHSTVTWCSQVGAEYRILVHGFSSQTGNFDLAISDDGVPCTATVLCLPVGACCFFDGSCVVSTEGDCSAQGGVYQGDDTECFNPVGNPAVTVTNPNLAIPDNNPVGVSDTINILDDVIIGDVDVDVVIDHTWVGDLLISIEHNGKVVALWDRPCGFRNDIDVIFDDEGGAVVCAQPTVGNIDPLTADNNPFNDIDTGPLSTFDGQSSAGTWTITVSDHVGLDVGTLIQWSLHITEGLPKCPQPIAGSLDIKPGSCPNPVNLDLRGVLPVAVVGTPELNAADVDRSTLQISRADGVGGFVAPLGGRPGPRRNLEDVATPFAGELCDCHTLTGDGVLDLQMKFDVQELRSVLELDSVDKRTFVELCVTGSLNDGTPFQACDCVRIQGRAALR